MAIIPPRADSSLFRRMIGAARLDPRAFEEVEHDFGATGQALTVVILSSAATGIGSGTRSYSAFVVGVLTSIALWYVWAYLTWWIGVRVVPEPGTRSAQDELLRTLGFATTPEILRVVGIVPGLGWLVFVVTGIWTLVAAVIAVRQALDYRSTVRAALVVAIGWLLQWIVLAIVHGVARVAA